MSKFTQLIRFLFVIVVIIIIGGIVIIIIVKPTPPPPIDWKSHVQLVRTLGGLVSGLGLAGLWALNSLNAQIKSRGGLQ
ncbi:hypothetical protein DYBT9275_02479 [Dyadobacter sp. CECT 9275]|uniref:Uncharacterized protein n=1 Tax=Dyadobacter helix TaxID=2822344 RepID=A0A916NLF9_9BACT|nr:hypothetical protein [Dyadobacter sp. CECT 9275]CAG5000516.1 hypothetical protein DYBT9275_02479 [Dyadobacter sp. CECT 9275]